LEGEAKADYYRKEYEYAVQNMRDRVGQKTKLFTWLYRRNEMRKHILALAVGTAMALKVICPNCVKSNLKSIVWELTTFNTTATCQAYYDQTGAYIPKKDCAVTTVKYLCSNGHVFDKEIAKNCIEVTDR
jgi:hypothetical protein